MYSSCGFIKSNDKTSVNIRFTRQWYCKVLEGIVTCSKENSLLRLDIREWVWMENQENE